LAIGGNPNSGKTTLFNRLTGLRQKVANYAGATVEKKLGEFRTPQTDVRIIDLPGTYGLTPKSEEERIAAEIILGMNKEVPRPEGVLCVVDSTCLEKSLYLVLQVIDTGIPAAVLLNMSDELALRGAVIDHERLSRLLGIPVLMISATKGSNLDQVVDLIDHWKGPVDSTLCKLPVIPSLEEVALRRSKAREIARVVIKKPLQPHPWSDKVDERLQLEKGFLTESGDIDRVLHDLALQPGDHLCDHLFTYSRRGLEGRSSEMWSAHHGVELENVGDVVDE